MGYLGYYFAWLALSYLIRQPWLLVGLLALWLLRGIVPPPGALFGALSRAGRLREQVRVNRANITARRDLATIYLELLSGFTKAHSGTKTADKKDYVDRKPQGHAG